MARASLRHVAGLCLLFVERRWELVLFDADVLAAVEQKEFGLILYFGRVSDRVVAEGEALCALGEEQRVTEGAEAVANDSDVAMDRAVGVDNPVGGIEGDDGPCRTAVEGTLDEGIVFDEHVVDRA